jgi:excisionase family DNA binding protein
MPTKYLTTTEAAEILGVHQRQVRHLCSQGRLGQRFGSVWMISDAELVKFAKKPRLIGRPAAG